MSFLSLHNKKLTELDMYSNSYYAYLDYIFDSLLDKNAVISIEKLHKFLNIHGNFSDILIKYLENKNTRIEVRKLYFIECFFMLFNTRIIKNKTEFPNLLYIIFENNQKRRLLLDTFISEIDNLIINFFMKFRGHNFEYLYECILRVNTMLKICFNGKELITYKNFSDDLVENQDICEFLQFIFCANSPIDDEIINQINLFLVQEKYNLSDTCFKLSYKPFLLEVFDKLIKKEICDFSKFDNECDSDEEQLINSALPYNISHSKNPNLNQENKINGSPSRLSFERVKYSFYSFVSLNSDRLEVSDIFNLNNFTNSNANLSPIRNKYHSVSKLLSLNNSNLSNNSSFSKITSKSLVKKKKKRDKYAFELEYFKLGKEKFDKTILSILSQYNAEPKYKFFNINSKVINLKENHKIKLDQFLFNKYHKISKRKNLDNIINCYFHKYKYVIYQLDNIHKEFKENSKYFYMMKIIDRNILIFKKENEQEIKLVNFIHILSCDIESIEFLTKQNLLILNLKDINEKSYCFGFKSIAEFNKLIYFLKINNFLINDMGHYKYLNNFGFIKDNKLIEFYRDKEKIIETYVEKHNEFIESDYLKNLYLKLNQLFQWNNPTVYKEIKKYLDASLLFSPFFQK